MPPRRQQQPSKETLPEVTITLSPVPYYALRSDHPDLQHLTWIGKSPTDALATATYNIRKHFAGRANVIIKEVS